MILIAAYGSAAAAVSIVEKVFAMGSKDILLCLAHAGRDCGGHECMNVFVPAIHDFFTLTAESHPAMIWVQNHASKSSQRVEKLSVQAVVYLSPSWTHHLVMQHLLQ